MRLIVTGVTNSSIVLQHVHIRRTHDGAVACEGIVVAFDAFMDATGALLPSQFIRSSRTPLPR
jgi:hypothetical protein